MAPTVTRFAPSPTGLLHLGSAYAALFAWDRARQAGGRFLLRIEDIDRDRCRPEYTVALIDDLRWLGLDWDDPVRVQSQHLPDYQATLDRLAAMGLLYPCFCSRADIAAASAPHGPNGVIYPGTCRHLSPTERGDRLARGDQHARRLDLGAAIAIAGPLTWHEQGEGAHPCHLDLFGDPVLAGRDTPSSYHLCVTHDDALQGVTLVTRAADLRPATSLHRLLQALLDLPEPGYAHHKLLLDASGRRLAKRDRALTLQALRKAGLSSTEVRRRALAG